MITLSAFADEIDPDLDIQMKVCAATNIRCIDVRGIDNKNVSAMTVKEVLAYRKRMEAQGFRVPCIGAPVGKVRMDEDFGTHLDVLKRCFDAAHAFGAKFVRVFSFYASQGTDIMSQRQAVMDRMWAMVKLAEVAGLVLLHENEKAIYGAKPAGVKDMFATVRSPAFKSIFDPANFVEEGIAPFDDGWRAGLDALTDYFHIKDKAPGAETCCPAGTGKGQIDELFADLKARNWSGYMTLEPHMWSAGQFAGFSGPDRFNIAADGLHKMLAKHGLKTG